MAALCAFKDIMILLWLWSWFAFFPRAIAPGDGLIEEEPKPVDVFERLSLGRGTWIFSHVARKNTTNPYGRWISVL